MTKARTSHTRFLCLMTPLTLGVLGLAALLLLTSTMPRPLAEAASHTVCPTGPPDCEFGSIQAAVDHAAEGDEILIAGGRYVGVSQRAGITQVVHISKSLSLRGGYTLTNWTTPDPTSHPTILDAAGQGRVLVGNQVTNLVLENLQLTGGSAVGLGGYQPSWGGPILDAGGGLYLVTSALTMQSCTVFSNTADSGGGLYLANSTGELTSTTVQSNTAKSGAGLFLNRCNPFALQANTVQANQAAPAEFDQGGGGLYILESSATLTGNLINSNSSTTNGGGLYLADSYVQLSSGKVNANVAGEFGGGLYILGGSATLENSELSANTVEGGGGAVCLRWGKATLTANVLTSNQADQGAGVDTLFSTIVAQDNIFSDNSATGACGGGLYISDSAFTLTQNTLRDNWAKIGGGALTLRLSTGRVERNLFEHNTALIKGGALATSTSDAYLEANQIVENSAADGGGLHLRESSTVTMVNNLLADNQTQTAGGGLFCEASTVFLTHNTLAQNSGVSGVHLTDFDGVYSRAYLTNTILVSHSIGITIGAGSAAHVYGTLWGNTTDWAGAGTLLTGTTNVWGAPAFVDPAGGDYHITQRSAALDVGMLTSTVSDLDRQRRPHYAGPDIGADEFWPLEASKRVSHTEAHPNDTITYTLRLTNTLVSAVSASLTDSLPPGITIIGPPIATNGTAGFASGVLTWTGTVEPGAVSQIVFASRIEPAASYPAEVANVATVQDPFAAFQTDPAVTQVILRRLFLPLVQRD